MDGWIDRTGDRWVDRQTGRERKRERDREPPGYTEMEGKAEPHRRQKVIITWQKAQHTGI